MVDDTPPAKETTDQNAPGQERNPDDHSRIIVLIYGTLQNDKPFWCYVAVKPSKYKEFLEAQKEGTLKLNAFQPFGEIIIYGEGHTPPEEVTLKVAEVYQTDPNNFFKALDPEEELKKQENSEEK